MSGPLDVATLAYVAGVVDMHGAIRLRTAHDVELPVVSVNGPNQPMLDFLAGLTGTRAIVTRRSYPKKGCADHCSERHVHVVSTSGRWSVTGVKATVLLWNVRPYMRLQVDAATMAISKGLATRYKPSTVRKMEDLGWDLPPFDPDWVWRSSRSLPGEVT